MWELPVFSIFWYNSGMDHAACHFLRGAMVWVEWPQHVTWTTWEMCRDMVGGIAVNRFDCKAEGFWVCCSHQAHFVKSCSSGPPVDTIKPSWWWIYTSNLNFAIQCSDREYSNSNDLIKLLMFDVISETSFQIQKYLFLCVVVQLLEQSSVFLWQVLSLFSRSSQHCQRRLHNRWLQQLLTAQNVNLAHSISDQEIQVRVSVLTDSVKTYSYWIIDYSLN